MKKILFITFSLFIIEIFAQEIVEDNNKFDTRIFLNEIIKNHPIVKKSALQYNSTQNNKISNYMFLIPERIDSFFSAGDEYATTQPLLTFSFKFSYRFFDPALFTNIKSGKLLEQASWKLLCRTKEQLLYNILKALTNLNRQIELNNLTIENYKIFTTYTDGIKAKVRANELSKSELAYALSRLSKFEADKYQAQQDWVESGLNLTKTANYFFIDEELTLLRSIPSMISNKADFDTDPLKHRSDLQQLQILHSESLNAALSSKISALPSFSFSVEADAYREQLTNSGAYNPEWYTGITCSIPISQIGKAVLNSKNAQNHADSITEDIALLEYSIKKNSDKYKSRISSLENQLSALKEATQQANIALEGIFKEFRAGTRTSFDIVDARSFYFDAIKNYTRKKFELTETKLDYMFNAGILLSTFEEIGTGE